jgi:hypothetical protein
MVSRSLKGLEVTEQQRMATYMAGLGYWVFPLVTDRKIPVEGMHWRTMSTSDVTVVADWWGRFPADNIGVNCGASDLVVFDMDDDIAADRFTSLWHRYEPEPWDAGRHPVVETRRGLHLYTGQPDQRIGSPSRRQHKLGALDIQGDGRMVVGPGSVVDGHERIVVAGDLSDVPTCPSWLANRVRPRQRDSLSVSGARWWRPPSIYRSQRELERMCNEIVRAPDGEQNNTIAQVAAFRMAHFCPPLDIGYVRDELEAAGERGNHPRDRTKSAVRSGLTHEWKPDVCPVKH